MELRWCKRCHKDKPVGMFVTSRTTKDGLAYCCDNCVPSRRKPVRDKPYLRSTHHHLKKYGMTALDYEQLLESQGGTCAICKQVQNSRKKTNGDRYAFHVDHEHGTKRVRGLLCHRCNIALGMIQDSIPIAIAMANYLVK